MKADRLQKRTERRKQIKKHKALYIMLLPAVLFLLVFVYYPFASGVQYAFSDVNLFLGTNDFVGLTHFKEVVEDSEFWNALINTAIMGIFNVGLGVILPAAMALLLNEVKFIKLKKTIQVILYLPSLFSWVVIGAIFMLLLSPSVGPINLLLNKLGEESIYFLGKPELARFLFIFIAQWKGVGYGLIIYLAAITNIDTTLYEAAALDGAGRWAMMRHITLPGIKDTAKMMLMFALMGLLSIFDQVLVMTNGLINDKVNVVMTYIYGRGIQQLKIGFASAAALLVGIITLIVTLVAMRALNFGFETKDD